MNSTRTLMNTVSLNQQGNRMIDSSIEFKKNIDKIMDDIEIMINRSYISDGSRSVAKKIQSYKQDLYNMGLTIGKYGAYCVKLSATVKKNQDRFMDDYKSV